MQLDLRPDEARALDELRDRTGLRSRADAVRFSLGVIEWIADQVASDRRILAVGDREVVYLAIPGVTSRAGNESELRGESIGVVSQEL